MLKNSRLILLVIFSLWFQSCSHYSGLSYREIASNEVCSELLAEVMEGKYITARKSFDERIDSDYSSRDAKAIKRNLDSILFIDYKHSFEALQQIHRGDSTLDKATMAELYDRPGFLGFGGSKPSKNYAATLDYLFDQKPDFSLDTFREVHGRLMKGGVDGIAKERVGVFRSANIIGNVPAGRPVTEAQFQSMVENPYIVTTMLNKGTNGYSGKIGYPNASTTTPEVLSMIEKSNPDLHERILKFQASGSNTNFEEITGDLINQLTEDLMDWFVKARDEIGEISSVAKFKEFAKTVAQFQRDLISIHPFYDGNGRTVRQFALYYPFWLEGLPPPRMVDPNNDLYSTVDKWTEEIIKGTYNSHALYENLIVRMDQSLRIGGEAELLFPHSPRKVGITFRSQKPRKTVKDATQMDVFTAQFAEYVSTRFKMDTTLAQRFRNDPYATLNELSEDYIKFAKTSYMDYNHAKFGEQRLGLEFVDQDFMESFGNQAYRSKDRWDYKMNRWYQEDVVWRGLSRRNQEIEEAELLSMFKETNSQFASNNIAGKINSPERAKELARSEFDRYNRSIIDGGIVEMAKDHSETGPQYGTSFGYSTSKKWEVGRAFAMGAMVVAEYGKHWDFQHLLKSRVLVGMKKARKDVELGRLKQLRPEFSYKYPRQVEVMGVGASDPDSVMFVQLIDTEGDAIISYVRNPKKPSEILVFDKDVKDLNEIPDDPVRVINLD
jgi:hypothetical protein